MSNISLDTEGERMMWGGIIGNSSIAFVTVLLVATGVMVGCLCKRCLRERAMARETAALYKAKANMTQLCVDDQGALDTVPSAPPYEATAV